MFHQTLAKNIGGFKLVI